MDCSSTTSSCTAERLPLGPAASISDAALWAFSSVRLVMMTWKGSDARASTLAVAKPTPEFAPVSSRGQQMVGPFSIFISHVTLILSPVMRTTVEAMFKLSGG